MNLILVKMFATALALSQVTTRPDAVRTEFDPVSDQGEHLQRCHLDEETKDREAQKLLAGMMAEA